MIQNELEAVVRRMWSAFARGDLQTVISCASADSVWRLTSAEYRGHDGMGRFFGDIVAEPGYGAVAYEFEARGEAVLVTGRVRAPDPFGALADRSVFWLFEGSGGMVTACTAFTDAEAAHAAFAAAGSDAGA